MIGIFVGVLTHLFADDALVGVVATWNPAVQKTAVPKELDAYVGVVRDSKCVSIIDSAENPDICGALGDLVNRCGSNVWPWDMGRAPNRLAGAYNVPLSAGRALRQRQLWKAPGWEDTSLEDDSNMFGGAQAHVHIINRDKSIFASHQRTWGDFAQEGHQQPRTLRNAKSVEGVDVLLLSSDTRLSNYAQSVAVSHNKREKRSNGRGGNDAYGGPLALALSGFVSLLLIAVGLMLIYYAAFYLRYSVN